MADVHQLLSTASREPATATPRKKRSRSDTARRERIVKRAALKLNDLSAVLQYLTRNDASEEEAGAAHELTIRLDALVGVLMSTADKFADLGDLEDQLDGPVMACRRLAEREAAAAGRKGAGT